MLHYLKIATTRNGVAGTILVMVMCITLIYYSPLSSYTQIIMLFPEKPQFKMPEIVESNNFQNMVPDTIQNMVPDTIQNMVPVAQELEIKIPEKVEEKVEEKIPVLPDKFEKCPLYFFGDSLYDTGMALYINMGPRADQYPYGKTFFKRPAGRFSDGLLIPDFIAQFAGWPFPEPYGNRRFKDYTTSVNFADSAAGVLIEGRKNTLNLKLQTDFFEEMVGKLKKRYGKKEGKKIVSKAVLVMNIGANDYVDMWIETPRPFNPSSVNSFANNILGNFTVAITRMYEQGARKFAFQSYGPVGCLPMFLHPDGTCAEDLNAFTKMHNNGFAKLAKTWARHMPGFNYIIYDFYAALGARVINGPQFGFGETKSACCGRGHFRATFPVRDNYTLCRDISSHLFFDPAHPTQKANLQFAQEFWSGTPNIVAPSNLETLFRMQTVD